MSKTPGMSPGLDGVTAMLRKILGFVALAAISSAANATFVPAEWTDSVGGSALVDKAHSYTYTHYIDDGANGFNAGSDVAAIFNLRLNVYDDASDSWFEGESGNISIGGYSSYGFSFLGLGAYIAGLIELNDFGSLTVTINSTSGDFMFGGSQLWVGGFRDTSTSVPEPATLGLMGLGLLGVGFSARRRKAAKN